MRYRSITMNKPHSTWRFRTPHSLLERLTINQLKSVKVCEAD